MDLLRMPPDYSPNYRPLKSVSVWPQHEIEPEAALWPIGSNGGTIIS